MRIFHSLFFLMLTINVFAQTGDLVIRKNGENLFVEHKVLPKENWYSVGRSYVISPKIIAAFNGLAMDKGLSIGQLLKVPLVADNFSQSVSSAQGRPVVHLVEQKEGLLKIASTYNVDIALLRKWNGLKSDQLSVGSALVVGYIVAAQPAPVAPTAAEAVQSQPAAPVKAPMEQIAPVAQSQAKQPAKAAEPQRQLSPEALKGGGYFSALYIQQTKEGAQQKIENPSYGVFKSTSGWQDSKYYILMNNVTPGTVVKIYSKTTERTLFAKVLGAVPPGKESEGMVFRMSNATAAALGVPNGEVGQFELVWNN